MEIIEGPETRQQSLSMPFLYSVFGLGLQIDRAIPGLIPLAGLPAIDVEVCLDGQGIDSLLSLEHTLYLERPLHDAQKEPVLRVWRTSPGDFFHLRYSDGFEFFVDRPGTRIWARAPAGAAPEELAVFILGAILGFTLRLRGIFALHASVIAIEGRTLALLGPPGAGKSTTAVVLAQRGFAVLADDVAAIREQGEDFWVFPGIPRLCLWPESVGMLFGSPDAFPRIVPENSLDPGWDKRYIQLAGGACRFQEQPLPLKAIYILGSRQSDAPPFVEALSQAEGMMELLANTYRNDLLDMEMRAQEFKAAGRIAAAIPIKRLSPHTDPVYLPNLCEVIVDDFLTLA